MNGLQRGANGALQMKQIDAGLLAAQSVQHRQFIQVFAELVPFSVLQIR